MMVRLLFRMYLLLFAVRFYEPGGVHICDRMQIHRCLRHEPLVGMAVDFHMKLNLF